MIHITRLIFIVIWHKEMGFNLALVLDIKSFIEMIHVIKVNNIIYLIWYPNYMKFNLAPI